ncbi:serine/threonine protein kinase [Xylanimonas oleitrophica]|uniref:non-specific serine/threonine protein kinase n=1 Tax=Xylanimonas oleitrophica TaxID=2607479 RepID=A0A2W5Y269_9MICO|nr:serine/threonine-protein kinase [Xylanimonas oleitrophica]PZR51624.1 serine/threonine protein kinase [Xylanimonas oleitrophica]
MGDVEGSVEGSQTAAGTPGRLATGTEVGGYTVRSLLGQGAMGAVYEAVDGGGEAVALKVLHAHLDTDPVARERLRREVQSLQRLRHPAVARVIDAELDGPEAFVVTDLVDGATLEDEVDEGGPLDPVDLYELADQLAGALEAVHLAGVVHRDLKPSNVMVTSHGPVIIDFGIAQAAGDSRAAALTSPGFVIGTPGYLAPELLDGGAPTPESDWWSWAALLAFAATGRSPFGVRPTELVLRRSREGRADLVGLPARTARALAGALHADPALRWGPTDVARSLRRDAEEAAAAARRLGAPLVGDDESTQRIAVHPEATQVLGLPTQDLGPLTEVMAPATDVLADPVYPLPPSVEPPMTAEERDRALANDGATRTIPAMPAPAAVPVGEVRYQPYEAIAGPQEPEVPEPYVRPVHRRRTGTVLAFLAPLVALAATRPGVAFCVLAALVVVCRVVGAASESLHGRRERRGGVRGSDGVVAALRLPWHVVAGTVGAVPQLLVAACAGVLVTVLGFWVFGDGRFVVLPRTDVASRAVGGVNATIVFCGVLAAAMLVAAVAGWFGPAGRTARQGARVTLGVLAPGLAGAAVAIAVCLVAAWLLARPLLDLPPVIHWWPFTGPPGF